MRSIVIIILVFTINLAGWGQDFRKYFGVAIDFNKPIVNKEFISSLSKKGYKVVYREFINDRLSIGGEAALASYNGYIPPAVYTQDDLTFIYTDIYAYVYSYSLAFSGEYFFSTKNIVMPYSGVGLGVAYNQFTMFYNVYKQQDNRWGALVRPHGGAILRFSKKSNWGIMADVHLDYATTKSEDTDYDKGFATVGFQAGLVFIRQ